MPCVALRCEGPRGRGALTGARAREQTAGLPDDMLGNIDLTVNPCDDFYEFACGKYDAEHEDKIPGFKSSVAFAWDQAEKDIREKEVAILKADQVSICGTVFFAFCLF